MAPRWRYKSPVIPFNYRGEMHSGWKYAGFPRPLQIVSKGSESGNLPAQGHSAATRPVEGNLLWKAVPGGSVAFEKLTSNHSTRSVW